MGRLLDGKTLDGSAKKEEGTTHFIHQRLTGALNVPLMMFLVWLVMMLAEADRMQMVSLIANPIVMVLLVLTIISACWHMALGLAVVIEDYVPKISLRHALIKSNNIFAFGVAILSIFSVLKLGFGG